MGIKDTLNSFYLNRKRLDFEHKESIYATQASCDLKLSDTEEVYKHQGACLRASYYSCIGIPSLPRTLEHSLMSSAGNSIESFILWALKEEDTLVSKGDSFTIEELNVNGKLDAIINDEDGSEIGLEIKTLSSNKYINERVFGNNWNKPSPKLEHLLQVIVYLYAFKDRLDKFKLVYIRRDTGETIEFDIELALEDNKLYPVIDGKVYNKISCDSVISKFKELNSFISSDTIPPKSYSPVYTKEEMLLLNKHKFLSNYMKNKYEESPFGDFECSYCNYRDICDKEK